MILLMWLKPYDIKSGTKIHCIPNNGIKMGTIIHCKPNNGIKIYYLTSKWMQSYLNVTYLPTSNTDLN